jgi:hypothetical protein
MRAPPSGPGLSGSPSTLALRAGPLRLEFVAGDLRYVKWGEREVVRRIYAAVRDSNWNTVPGEISGLEIQHGADAFHIAYTSTHQQAEVCFVWRADIRGGNDGSIRFHFDGEAQSTFLRNRIGLCVLHPIGECVGASCRARYANGTGKELRFPDAIAGEQPVTWLHDLCGLDHEVAPGVWAALDFAGDLFETEDQRNWTDASFKTYSTPLRLPFPMEIRAGTRVQQEVRLRIVGGIGRGVADGEMADSGPGLALPDRGESLIRHGGEQPVIVRLASGVSRLPELGLGLPDRATALEPDQEQRLRDLRLAHLRVDLRLWEEDWAGHFERAEDAGRRVGAKLEVALHLNENPGGTLASVAEALASRRGSVTRVLVFQRNQKSTTPAALNSARAALSVALPGVPLGAGTDADLYQLQFQRPPADADFICWSMNPQVHAFDDTSLAETPEGAAHQVISVRRYFPGKPLVVSPVTLRPRFNPNATGPAPDIPPGELPPQVDSRQVSLLGAAWTLAMVQALAESAVDAATFYETIGWRGVMETLDGSPIPSRFPSIAGAVYPLYHVLADVGEFAGGEVHRTVSSQPLAVASLLLACGVRRRLVVANLGSLSRRIAFVGLGGIRLLRCLDSTNCHQAMTQPELFRASPMPEPSPLDCLELGPGAIATLDSTSL